uniref:Uncharacterized protein n=1 Tax=Aegilops tauschii TaxID=37682 RepID=R7WFZ1_AEGTA
MYMFEKYLAAEALRINENDAEKALDLLTNPELNCALQEQLANNEEEAANNEAEALPNDAEAGANEEAVNQDQDMGDEAEEEDLIEEEAGASHAQGPVRDVAMENELANELTGDALDDYDIDVANEGQAIAEYLSLLESAAAAASSS